MTDVSYFNISEMKLSITSLYIISDAINWHYDINWTDSCDVIVSFALTNLIEYHLINLTNWSNTYIKTSVERGIMFSVPSHSYFIWCKPITLHLYNQIGHVKNNVNNVNQNSFNCFDDLACRPECRSMRVCSARR